jgi:CheY-like chemotaxis protein
MITSAAPECKPINIVLVEDDDIDAEAVRRAFQRSKIANPIVRAVDGLDALEMLTGKDPKTKLLPPYLLLVDLNMPRMNGIQLVQALRADANLRHSIVFMLTTSKREEDKIAAYDLNVAGYILKASVGEDFLALVSLMHAYWRIVELPRFRQGVISWHSTH